MSDEVLGGLLEWVKGKSVSEIKSAIEGSQVASSIRDVDALSKYLFAKSNGLI